jgi:hypothetical protein
MTTISGEQRLVDFAKKAAEYMGNDSRVHTFGDVEPGTFLAIRWGLGDDCLMVVKLDEDFQPINFQQAIPRGKEPGND